MDNKKWDQLIELYLSENKEASRALFHDIIVEQSRQLYESIMDEEYAEEGMHGHDQVGTLLDEIDVEEAGMHEAEDEEDEFDFDGEGSDEEGPDGEGPPEGAGEDEVVALGDEGDEGDVESRIDDLEDRVVSSEERIEKLMADFEKKLGMMGDEDEEGGMPPEGEDDEAGMPPEDEEDEEGEEDEEPAKVTESHDLKRVSMPSRGDNGAHAESVVSRGPRVGANGAGPVNWGNGSAAGRSTPKVETSSTSYGNRVGGGKATGQKVSVPHHASPKSPAMMSESKAPRRK